jgi:hypothetical protein
MSVAGRPDIARLAATESCGEPCSFRHAGPGQEVPFQCPLALAGGRQRDTLALEEERGEGEWPGKRKLSPARTL